MSSKDDLIKDFPELAVKEKAIDMENTAPEDPKRVSGGRQIVSLEREQELRDWARSLGYRQQFRPSLNTSRLAAQPMHPLSLLAKASFWTF